MPWPWTVLLFAAGAALALLTLLSAVRTFVLPRGVRDPITRAVFLSTRGLVCAWLWPRRASEATTDRVMALYAPLTLLVLPAVWLVALGLGFTLMLRALPGFSWTQAVVTAGGALLTLGLPTGAPLPVTLLGFAAAGSGLTLLTLLIAYLPTIYTAFSRREGLVTRLSVRAGTPPTGTALLEWHARLRVTDELGPLWRDWEVWFADIAESHTSLGSLAFFRSPNPGRSWVSAAGTVLDAAALAVVNVRGQDHRAAMVCLAAGTDSLSTIARYFGLCAGPVAGAPISVTRAEFDAASARLAAAGHALREDRALAWTEFEHLRRGYDEALLALAEFVLAPAAPWSSDRSLLWPRAQKHR